MGYDRGCDGLGGEEMGWNEVGGHASKISVF